VEEAARALLRALAELPDPPTVQVAEGGGRVRCLIQVWDATQPRPALGERRKRSTGKRDECKTDILAVIAEAHEALTRKEVVRALKLAQKPHGTGTVAKALADLTTSGELVNPRDKRGYRLASWRRNKTGSLFD
jgi:hypothetical protein